MNGLIAKLFSEPWLIDESALDAIIRQAARFDESMIRIAMEQTGKQDPPPYQVKDGVAIIKIRGPLTKEPSFFSFLMGARTYSDIVVQGWQAANDPAVDRIVRDIDSPGGTVAGAFEAAASWEEIAKIKPVSTFASGQFTSAALLIGSPGDEIATVSSTGVGSIGVVTVHADYSAMNERIGEKITYITAGKYKAYGNPDEPLSSDARAYFQKRLDRMYALFVDAVSRYRGMTTEQVVAAADGKVFLADQARELGLVDRIVANLDDYLKLLISEEEGNMDVNELRIKHPDLYAQVAKEGETAGRTAAETEAKEKIAVAGNDAAVRIIDLVRVVAGEETAAKVKSMADTGMSADQLAAVKSVFAPEASGSDPGSGTGTAAADALGALARVLGIEPEKLSAELEKMKSGQTGSSGVTREQILDAIETATAKPLSANPAGGQGGKEESFMDLVDQYMAQNKDCTRAKAISIVRAKNPEAHEKWIAEQNSK